MINKVLDISNISDDEGENLTENDLQRIKKAVDRENLALSIARGEIVIVNKSKIRPKKSKRVKKLSKNSSKINSSKTTQSKDTERQTPKIEIEKMENSTEKHQLDTNLPEENSDFSLTGTEKDNSISSAELEKYYETLGAKKDDSLESIRSKYRQEALKLHPDRNASGEEEFKKLSEAIEAINAA